MTKQLWNKVSLDAMQNSVSGLGVEGRDKLYSLQHVDPTVITQPEEERIFRGDSIGKRMILKPANDMTRNWFEIQSSDLNPKKMSAIEKKISDLGFKSAFRNAIAMSRKSGAGVIWLGVDDGYSSKTSQPVREKQIKDIKWLKVFERHDLTIEEKYDDPSQPNYNDAKVYRVNNTGVLIHESRTLRFDGVLTTDSQQRTNGGWSDSIFISILEPLRNCQAAFHGLMAILAEGPQSIFKIKGLAEILSSDHSDLARQRLSIMDLYKSVYRTVPMDADGEDFERYSLSAEGVPEGIDRIMIYLSACSDMPATVLWGRSPAGENATGQSDLEIYYNWINEEQEDKMSPNINKFMRYLFLAKKGPTNGKEPKQWSYAYRPLWSPSDKDKAQARQIQSYTDQVYVQNTILTPEEIRASRFTGGEHTLDNTLLDEAAYQKRKKELEEQGGGGIFGTQQTMNVSQDNGSEDEGQEDDRKNVEENNSREKEEEDDQ